MGNNLLKVLHLVAGDLSGGAARGAYWLHLGLGDAGVASKILTDSKSVSNYRDVVSILTNPLSFALARARRYADSEIFNLYRGRQPYFFSSGLFGPNLFNRREYLEADIVHLHWVNDGFVNFKHLAGIAKPVVWTMRDMWPMTGGCHYAIGCERYAEGCGCCPLLASARNRDLTYYVLRRKKNNLPANLNLVGISSWLSDCARQSEIFRDCKIQTIHNNIDTRDFYPVNKAEARLELQLPANKKIILVGAQYLDATYKGFDLCIEALQQIETDALVLFLGNKLSDELSATLKCELVSLGYLDDTSQLRLAYSAADVFVAASRLEAFGKMLVEAMACGTPVACFDATGPKDIVTHKKDGYKARPFEPGDLAAGIDWILEDDLRRSTLAEKAIARVAENFDVKITAQKYIALYKDILAGD